MGVCVSLGCGFGILGRSSDSFTCYGACKNPSGFYHGFGGCRAGLGVRKSGRRRRARMNAWMNEGGALGWWVQAIQAVECRATSTSAATLRSHVAQTTGVRLCGSVHCFLKRMEQKALKNKNTGNPGLVVIFDPCFLQKRLPVPSCGRAVGGFRPGNYVMGLTLFTRWVMSSGLCHYPHVAIHSCQPKFFVSLLSKASQEWDFTFRKITCVWSMPIFYAWGFTEHHQNKFLTLQWWNLLQIYKGKGVRN